jgi:guanyl-specific ribonuclease Sa
MHWMSHLRVVVLGLALTLSACSVAQADRAATPTQTVPDLGSSAQPPLDAEDPSAAIEQAMLDSLRAQGAPTENAKIVVQKIADGYARVAVYYDVVGRPAVWDLGFAYLEHGAWKAWAFGSGIAQEHVEAAGIPRSVWPDGWLSAPSEGDNCPETTSDTRLLKIKRHGYCLLYPVGYKVEKPSQIETDLVVGSLLNAEAPRVNIRVEDAGGGTADELAKQITVDLGDFPIERSGIVLGNVEAIVLDKLPGQDVNRQVLFEHDGLLYHLTFWPADEKVGDAYTRMEVLYDTIVASFAFTPRSDELVPGEDCLEASPDTQSLTREAHNFCLLYPNGYDVDEPAENETVLFMGSLLDVTHPKLFVEVQDAAGRTAEQIADELATEVQRSMPDYDVERSFGLSVGYEPAWQLENMPGQEISRQVIVVHDGRLYKLTFVPADNQVDEVHTQLESLYTTVIDSFRFLR